MEWAKGWMTYGESARTVRWKGHGNLARPRTKIGRNSIVAVLHARADRASENPFVFV